MLASLLETPHFVLLRMPATAVTGAHNAATGSLNIDRGSIMSGRMDGISHLK